MRDAFRHDLQIAIRSLRRSGAFTTVTILTLGLGIGAVTALAAVVSAVLLNPLVPEQDRVVQVSKRDVARGGLPFPLSLPEFWRWRDQSRSFAGVAAVNHAATGTAAITIGDRPSTAQVAPVSVDFFRVVHPGGPLYGRWFRAADEQPGAEVVAIVSARFWRRAAGRDPAFVGQRLSWAGDRTLRVVGIAPAEVDYPLGTDVWVPADQVFDGKAGRFDARDPEFWQFELVGRLAPGVSVTDARAELSAIHQRDAKGQPQGSRPMQVVVEPLLDTVVGNTRRVLRVLFAAAGLVFLIAGVNVAALLLMRATERRAEVAVRIALGASRARLFAQTVAEGLVLGTLGALAGISVAHALLGMLRSLAPAGVPRIESAALDLRVLSFGAAAALAWMIALGTFPMWTLQRTGRAPGFARSSQGALRTRGLFAFTVVQVATAVVLVIGAGLLLRTFAHLQAIDRGFDSHGALLVSLLLPEGRHRDRHAMLAFYDRLLPEVESLPGVVSASPIHVGPGSGAQGLSATMIFEGQTPDEARTNPWSTWEPVLPSYFRTLGIPIVRGRGFTDADRRGAAPVAIVSETVAQRYWPGRDPIGKRVQFVPGSDFPWMSVVGVAADTRYRELTKPWMTVYFPADQSFFFQAASLVVRTSTPQAMLVPALRRTIQAAEPGATIKSVASLDRLLASELSRPLTALTVAGFFALAAIALAAVGVYGVLSYEVRQRRRELAVRAAVGAAPADIFRAVLRRSLVLGAAGATAGLVVAALVTHTLTSLLFEVQPLDPVVFLAGAGGVLTVTLAAAYFPARRAVAMDPMVALRMD